MLQNNKVKCDFCNKITGLLNVIITLTCCKCYQCYNQEIAEIK